MSAYPISVALTLGVSGLAIVTVNISICTAVLRYKVMRSYTNFFVLSLAVSDTLVGGALLPMYLFSNNREALGYIVGASLFTNVANLVIITLERLLAVTRALMYRTLIARYYVKMIIAAWVIPLIINAVPFLWDYHNAKAFHGYYIFIVVCITSSYIFIIVSYAKIFQVIRVRMKMLHHGSTGARAQKNNVLAQKKVCKVFALVSVLFCACWFPIIFMTICLVAEYPTLITQELSIASIYTISLSSLANPCLYGFFKTDFRRVFTRWLSICLCGFIHNPADMQRNLTEMSRVSVRAKTLREQSIPKENEVDIKLPSNKDKENLKNPETNKDFEQLHPGTDSENSICTATTPMEDPHGSLSSGEF